MFYVACGNYLIHFIPQKSSAVLKSTLHD